MTPTDFESRARDAAYSSTYTHAELSGHCGDPTLCDFESGFYVGAQWSRRETIAEILTMLQNEKDHYLAHADWWADWLELELQKDAPKAKEGCYSDYQNG